MPELEISPDAPEFSVEREAFDQTAPHDHRPGASCPFGDWPSHRTRAEKPSIPEPFPHRAISPAILEFRIKELTEERDAANARCDKALDALAETKAKLLAARAGIYKLVEHNVRLTADVEKTVVGKTEELLPQLLERHAAEIADRDRRIKQLENLVENFARHVDAMDAETTFVMDRSLLEIAEALADAEGSAQ